MLATVMPMMELRRHRHVAQRAIVQAHVRGAAGTFGTALPTGMRWGAR
jgi:hypothetical protein